MAIGKSIRSNACQAFRKIYLHYAGNVAENLVFNPCHPFLYPNAPESSTSFKRSFPPIFHSVRDVNSIQLSAPQKSTIPYACYSAKINGSEFVTIAKGPFPYTYVIAFTAA
ncbi:hypothetical protein Barb6_03220 [Bacteroidales bacterium Barb6]|nr:hypothetical protein Barb6_03220 [Bacteroidales bacterium Barb6]